MQASICVDDSGVWESATAERAQIDALDVRGCEPLVAGSRDFDEYGRVYRMDFERSGAVSKAWAESLDPPREPRIGAFDRCILAILTKLSFPALTRCADSGVWITVEARNE